MTIGDHKGEGRLDFTECFLICFDYSVLEMGEYLLPLNDKLKVEENQKLFVIRNRRKEIPYNLGTFEICIFWRNKNIVADIFL